MTCRDVLNLQCKNTQRKFHVAVKKLEARAPGLPLDTPWVKLTPQEMHAVLTVTGDRAVFLKKVNLKKGDEVLFDGGAILGASRTAYLRYWYFWANGKLRGIYLKPRNKIVLNFYGRKKPDFSITPPKQTLDDCIGRDPDGSATSPEQQKLDSPSSVAEFFNANKILNVQVCFVHSWRPFLDSLWLRNVSEGAITIHAYRDDTGNISFAQLSHFLPGLVPKSSRPARQPQRELVREQNYNNRGSSVHARPQGLAGLLRLCLISAEEFHDTVKALSLCNGFLNFVRTPEENSLVYYCYRDFNHSVEGPLCSDADWVNLFSVLEERSLVLTEAKQLALQPILDKVRPYAVTCDTAFKRCLRYLETCQRRTRFFIADRGDSILHAIKLPMANYFHRGTKFSSLYMHMSRDNDLVSIRYNTMTLCNLAQALSLFEGRDDDDTQVWAGLDAWAGLVGTVPATLAGTANLSSDKVCREKTESLFLAHQCFARFLSKKYSIDINTMTHVNLSLVAREMFWSKYIEKGGFFFHPIEQSLVANELYLRKFCKGGFSFSSKTAASVDSPIDPAGNNRHIKAAGIVGLDINSSYGYAATHMMSPCGFGSTFIHGQRQEKSQRYRFFEFRAVFFTIHQWLENGDKKLVSAYHNFSPLGLFFVGKHPVDLVGVFEDGDMELVQFDGAFVHGCPNEDCPTLPSYANGATRNECEQKTACRDDYIKTWIRDTGKDNISYRVIHDCCNPGYTPSDLNAIYKAIPELQKLISGYSSVTGSLQDLDPGMTFLAVATVTVKSSTLHPDAAAQAAATDHYGPLFAWKNHTQVMTWKAKRFLLTKDYYLYLKENFDEVVVDNIEWTIFYKTDEIFPSVYKHFLDARSRAPAKSIGAFFKSVININCGMYGANPAKTTAKYIRLTTRLPRDYDSLKHTIVDLQEEEVSAKPAQATASMTTNHHDMFIVKTSSVPKHVRTKNNALPIFCSVIEFGKMRLNQLYYTLNRAIDPRFFKLHYAQIDSSIFTFANSSGLEASLAASPYIKKTGMDKKLLHPTLPGHFHTEFEFGIKDWWKFATSNTCAWAIKTIDTTQDRSKMSSVALDHNSAYWTQMNLLAQGHAELEQSRRVNKVGGRRRKSTTLHLAHGGAKKKKRPRQDSNLQSSDPKSDALSIRPRGQL